MFSSVFTAPLAFAAILTIGPGQSVEVPAGAGEATTVTCTAPAVQMGPAAPAVNHPSTFCFCRARGVGASSDYPLVKAVVAGASRSETELKSFDSQKDCDAAISTHPACR